MDAERLTGLIAAIEVFENLHGSFTKCVERMDKISESEVIQALERGEEYQVHRAAMNARKITDALAFMCERVSAVDNAFSAALNYLQSELNDAQGTPGLDLRPSDADAEDFL